MEFASQRGFDRFVGLDLTAGKLPQAALVLCVGTTGNQDLATAIADDGGGDMDSFHFCSSSSPAFCQALKAGHW
ncbi:hypothetical protein D3C76_1472770 [compost metagenome]